MCVLIRLSIIFIIIGEQMGLKSLFVYSLLTGSFVFLCAKYHQAILESVLRSGNGIKLPNRREYAVSPLQKERLERLSSYCKRHKSTHNMLKFMRSPRQNKGHFYVSHEKNLLYCSVPKVASTNWKRLILLFEGSIKSLTEPSKEKTHTIPQIKLFNIMSKGEMQTVLKHYFKFFIVRHPFERLASAYRNKFADHNDYFEKTYGTKIIQLYRHNDTSADALRGRGVTFHEFAQWIIDKKVFDAHWVPVFSLCYPCFLPFDYIGKMETLVEDSNNILSLIRAKQRFPANLTDGYKVSSQSLMYKYFKTVSNEMINHLYKVYESDFIAFGYQVPEKLFHQETF